MKNQEQLKKLNELFGSYRAEWLQGKIFDYFTEPSYFIELKDSRPCVLQGGRGTGKTTVLKGLSYMGQYALHNQSMAKFDECNFIGIYHRINTNHVRAFKDGGLDEVKWSQIFGHYFNIIICREILQFLDWYRTKSGISIKIDKIECSLIAKSLHIENRHNNLSELLVSIEDKMYEFQAQINNIADGAIPLISMAGDPIKIITRVVNKLPPFSGKIFYLLIDEYENLEDYQQRVLNTLIKHNPENYTFKIGVRELGWRIKQTLNPAEALHDPADYVLFDLGKKLAEEARFKMFAKDVCQKRIEELISEENKCSFSIEESLQSMSIEEEAELLKSSSNNIDQDFSQLPDDQKMVTDNFSWLKKFFLTEWANSHNESLCCIVADYLANTKKWETSYDNYKYSMLFKIRKGRGMGGIQKYYSGWNIYVLLSHGNIRYLMELVYRAYEKHLNNNKDILVPVSHADQTNAAREVGEKNLMELEGLCVNGAQLTRMLLGFGRIFNLLACSTNKKRPEVNQFFIKGLHSVSVNKIITDAVMNLALIRLPGNKLNDVSHTKEYLYMLHPIYAPYFVYSHRKKRKLDVSESDFLDIIAGNDTVIKSIASEYIVTEDDVDQVDQMKLF